MIKAIAAAVRSPQADPITVSRLRRGLGGRAGRAGEGTPRAIPGRARLLRYARRRMVPSALSAAPTLHPRR